MPSSLLTLLRTRVPDLERRVAAVRSDMDRIASAENALRQRIGARPTSYANVIAGGAVPTAAAAFINPLLAPPIAMTMTAQRIATTLGVGPWPDFDQQWARTTGPKVAAMRQAMLKVTDLASVLQQRNFDQGERVELANLVTRSRTAVTEATNLFDRWIASPMMMFDTSNTTGLQRAMHGALRAYAPAVGFAATLLGSSEASTAGYITQAIDWVGEKATQAAQWAESGGDYFTNIQPPDDNPDRPPPSSPWPTIATLGLLAGGLFIGYRVVKDVVLSKGQEQS